MNKNMLTFEFLMINSLLVMNTFPQNLKPFAYFAILVPLSICFWKCYKEAV